MGVVRKSNRFLRGMSKRESSARVETFDGLLWDIDEVAGTCRVKAFSDNSTMITVKYPLNWNTRPPWLKEGTVVRITRTGLHQDGLVYGGQEFQPVSTVNRD